MDRAIPRPTAAWLAMTVLGVLASTAIAQTTQPADTLPPSTQPTTFPSTQPATMPATMPTTQAAEPQKVVISRITGKELPPPPPQYDLLASRTVFTKTRIAPPPVVPTVQQPPPPPPPVRMETSLVFNGVTDVDGVGYAVFEDTIAGKILGFKVGDAIANGKITAISLDGLEYEANGRTVKVLVGQNLDGSDAPDISSRAVVTGGASSQPASTGNPNEDAVLKALREKRLKAMGQ